MTHTMTTDRRSETRRILRTALPPARRALPGIASGVAMGLAVVALMATSAWLIVRAAEQPPVLFLTMATVGVRAFALARSVFRYLERLYSHDAAFRQLAAMRVDLLERLIPWVPAGRGRASSGSVLNALVTDVDELQNLSLRVVNPVITSTIVAVAAVIGVSLISPPAAAVLGLTLVICAVVAMFAGTRVAAASERLIAPHREQLVRALTEYTVGYTVLAHYGADVRALDAVREADAAATRAALRRSAAVGIGGGVITLGAGLTVAVSIFAALPIAQHAGSGPAFAVVALVPLAVFEVIGALPLALGHWRVVRASAERLADVAPTTLPAELPGEAQDNEPVGPQDTTLRLADVSARWPGSGSDILRDVDLEVRPGECVLISGPSGAGKSTLAAVLARFIEHTGTYEIGGRTASNPRSVREIVGVCEQHPHIFDESIRQNLLFAHDAATDDDLWNALDAVGLRNWAKERGGLDVRVGERGALISGGQAQRLSLARALLRGFPILVLDEPTANVDAARAQSLMRSLLSAAQERGRSIVLLSHDDVPEDLIDRRFTVREGRLV